MGTTVQKRNSRKGNAYPSGKKTIKKFWGFQRGLFQKSPLVAEGINISKQQRQGSKLEQEAK
jgi:hypothetical protein